MAAAIRIAATFARHTTPAVVAAVAMPRLLHSADVAMVPMMAMSDDLVAAAVASMMTMSGELA